jgi:hypothetical protein
VQERESYVEDAHDNSLSNRSRDTINPAIIYHASYAA